MIAHPFPPWTPAGRFAEELFEKETKRRDSTEPMIATEWAGLRWRIVKDARKADLARHTSRPRPESSVHVGEVQANGEATRLREPPGHPGAGEPAFFRSSHRSNRSPYFSPPGYHCGPFCAGSIRGTPSLLSAECRLTRPSVSRILDDWTKKLTLGYWLTKPSLPTY